ncbi:MAG: hypothetical protein PHV47_01790, partial [Candidatus Pacebacteria bacterium]|nr:hypothetical protein [Candidatus Paceibacterota bacterium]
MTFELTKEQRWEIFNSLPENLKDAIFSGDTADAVSNICKLHNIDDTASVAKIVGQVLIGLLPPDKIAEAIKEKILPSEDSLCNTLAIEIQHYILDPVMNDLQS